MNIIKPKRKMTNRWICSDKIIFDGENITITLRELLASVIIVAVMFFLGSPYRCQIHPLSNIS